MARSLAVAVLDANVLIPAALRDLLLSLADEDLFRPVWQTEILGEVQRNSVRLLEERGLPLVEAAHAAGHAQRQMARAFPDACHSPEDRHAWGDLVKSMTNDPKDRHVLAAAVATQATHLVTSNTKDFPATSLPDGLALVTPDEFTCWVLGQEPVRVVQAVTAMAARLQAPPATPQELARKMATGANLSKFGAALVTHL